MPFLAQVRVVVALQEDGGGTASATVRGTASGKCEDKLGVMLVEATISSGKTGLPAAVAVGAAACRGIRDAGRGKGVSRGFEDTGGVYWPKVGPY